MGRACSTYRGEKRWGSMREGNHSEDSGVDGRIILKWILEKWDGGHGLDLSGSGQRQVAGSCKCGSEPSEFYNMRGIS
jgi:hypothetical protein